MVKISIVMGAYNGADLLDETLGSIFAQTERDFELIVVDDGSTDATSAILASCRDPRLRVIRQENAGLTRALIRGCAEARGAYIARHDVGDLSRPERLERQATLLDADPQLAFVSCDTAFLGPQREPLFVKRSVARLPLRSLDMHAPPDHTVGPTSHGSVMFRRTAYERAGGYRAQFYYGQDWDLWYRLAEVGTFQAVDAALYEMRVLPEGISTAARKAQFELSLLSEEAKHARACGASEEVILERAAAIRNRSKPLCARAQGFYFIGEALRRNGDRRAQRYLVRAVLSCPIHVRSWFRLAQSLLVWVPHPRGNGSSR